MRPPGERAGSHRRVAAACLLVCTGATSAADIETFGGATVVGQVADTSVIESELTASADLFVRYQTSRGFWTLYLEGNTTPRDGGVSQALGEANADAGTAVDDERDGRVQISEIEYTHTAIASLRATIGILDATEHVDRSAVAGNETRAFLGASFVNNPAVELPDYAPGVVVSYSGESVGVTALITASEGLADNPGASYSQLLNVDDDDRGVFAVAELLRRAAPFELRLGAWLHTSPHRFLDGRNGTEQNHGVYASIDRLGDSGACNLRLGAARASVFRAARFAGLACRRAIAARLALGAGIARVWASDDSPPPRDDNIDQVELFMRYGLYRNLHVTPGVQWIRNSGFDEAGPGGGDVVVSQVRVGFEF